jgi:hypothetical protein
MKYTVEEIYRTEGVPEFTFVKPPNFNELLVDFRNQSKPVIVEGQSGSGKTTAAKKIIELVQKDGASFTYLSARKETDIPNICRVADTDARGVFIIDDFHRLAEETQVALANRIKIAAEELDPNHHPKVVIIGINKVGSELIDLVPDIAKRCGIHRIQPASREKSIELIEQGEQKLRVVIQDKNRIVEESNGDYWLIQLLAQTQCLVNEVTESQDNIIELPLDLVAIRKRVVERLQHSYHSSVKEFCRGKRFRATNDPYFKLLREIGRQESSIVDLQELANAADHVKGSINNIKEWRLSVLLDSKPNCARHFYYNSTSKNFAIEDPALFYYLKHLDWEAMRQDCGFRYTDKDYEFDIAISFAGENREIARILTDQLQTLDCSVFYDRLFEANFLGSAWRKQFEDIFRNRSRLVVCILDKNHSEKIWPTFERECFSPRVIDRAVIPVFLDETLFPGIPQDIIGIKFDAACDNLENSITDLLAIPIVERLSEA